MAKQENNQENNGELKKHLKSLHERKPYFEPLFTNTVSATLGFFLNVVAGFFTAKTQVMKIIYICVSMLLMLIIYVYYKYLSADVLLGEKTIEDSLDENSIDISMVKVTIKAIENPEIGFNEQIEIYQKAKSVGIGRTKPE